jgi:chorismate mutase
MTASEPNAPQASAINAHDVIPPELKRLRDSIDNIDAAMIHLLAERFKCTQLVGELKARLKLPASDPTREEAQMARMRQLAKSAQLDPDFAEKFLTFTIREVIRHHEILQKEGCRNETGT